LRKVEYMKRQMKIHLPLFESQIIVRGQQV
jgi:hypothetical protein